MDGAKNVDGIRDLNDEQVVEIQRDMLKKIVKKIKTRIKQIEQERKDNRWFYEVYDNYDERKRELIDLKISLEKWRKLLRYEFLEKQENE